MEDHEPIKSGRVELRQRGDTLIIIYRPREGVEYPHEMPISHLERWCMRQLRESMSPMERAQ